MLVIESLSTPSTIQLEWRTGAKLILDQISKISYNREVEK